MSGSESGSTVSWSESGSTSVEEAWWAAAWTVRLFMWNGNPTMSGATESVVWEIANEVEVGGAGGGDGGGAEALSLS